MKAKEYLKQVIKIDKMINNKMYESMQWKSVALGTTVPITGERVQSSSSSKSKMADAMDKYMDIQAEINADIDRLIAARQDIIKLIEQLSAVEYDVLHKVYIQLKTFDVVAIETNHSYSWVTTVHGRALKHVQELLNKKGVQEYD